MVTAAGCSAGGRSFGWDAFDLEIASEDPADIIRACQLLEPTVGGINLEDIRAPDCFVIEAALRQTLAIPVFHDNQHGTAIISGAALVNALELVGKHIADVRVVFSGAGAAALATAAHFERLSVARDHIVLWRGQAQTARSQERRNALPSLERLQGMPRYRIGRHRSLIAPRTPL